MTKEELLQALTENVDAKAWLTDAGYYDKDALEKETAGLRKNRDDILFEKRKLDEKFTPISTEYGKIKNILRDKENILDKEGNINYDALEKLVYANNISQASGEDVEIWKRKATRYENDLKDKESFYHNEIDGLNKYIHKVEVENTLQNLLAKSGDFPVDAYEMILPSLVAKSGAKIEKDADGNRRAITEDGKSIVEWFDAWKESPAGKALRIAKQSSGGGAGGGNSQGSTKPFSQMTPQERSHLYSTNKALYDSLKASNI